MVAFSPLQMVLFPEMVTTGKGYIIILTLPFSCWLQFGIEFILFVELLIKVTLSTKIPAIPAGAKKDKVKVATPEDPIVIV